MSAQTLRVLVDDEAATPHGLASVPWHEASPWLGRHAELQACWLRRGAQPRTSGLRTIPFPAHQRMGCAADSLLLQQLCDQLGIDLFISSGPTTPVCTPSICLVDETSLSACEEAQASGRHHDLAWRFACRLLCATDAVGQRLLRSQPDLQPRKVVVATLNWQVDAATTWGPALCDDVARLGRQVQCEMQAGLWQPFFAEWTRLRRLQLAVDV